LGQPGGAIGVDDAVAQFHQGVRLYGDRNTKLGNPSNISM